MLLVFPEALSGWASQARCCEQLYYEQPYCICRVAPTVRPNPAALHPCNLTHSSKRNHLFSKFIFRKSLMTLLSELIIILFLVATYCHPTLAWLRDKVRGRHHRAYSLAWPRNKVRGGHHRAFYIIAPGNS